MFKLLKSKQHVSGKHMPNVNLQISAQLNADTEYSVWFMMAGLLKITTQCTLQYLHQLYINQEDTMLWKEVILCMKNVWITTLNLNAGQQEYG